MLVLAAVSINGLTSVIFCCVLTSSSSLQLSQSEPASDGLDAGDMTRPSVELLMALSRPEGALPLPLRFSVSDSASILSGAVSIKQEGDTSCIRKTRG